MSLLDSSAAIESSDSCHHETSPKIEYDLCSNIDSRYSLILSDSFPISIEPKGCVPKASHSFSSLSIRRVFWSLPKSVVHEEKPKVPSSAKPTLLFSRFVKREGE